MFYILLVTKDGGKTWTPEFDNQFETGTEANRSARSFNEYQARWYPNSTTRKRVRKVVDTDDDNYITREAAKNHTPVPWEQSRYTTKWMLPHIDPANPVMIRFFARVSDAVEGKYTSVKVSRYLSRYEDMTEETIEEILVKMGVYANMEFGITTDPKEVQAIYMNGPTSCMNDPDDYDIPDDPHPSIVYSAGDLAVAYIGNGESYSARTIVYPEKKIYIGGYGHTTLLYSKLKELGYKLDRSEDSWEGARVKAVQHGGEYLMPYLDMSGYAKLSDCGEFFELTGSYGDYECRTTEGYAYEDGHYENDHYYEDDY